jgi:nucleotide-binding universal stress UspA family protein
MEVDSMSPMPPLLNRIVVPLDGSAVAEAVLPELRNLLRQADSEVILVRSEYPLVADTYPPVVLESSVTAAKSYLRRIEDRLAEEGVRTRTIADLGPAADFILRVARQERATLIALSTHGRSGASRVLMGSIAEQVVRESPVPVLAVRTLSADSSTATPSRERRPIRNVLLPLDRSERSIRALEPASELCRLFGARLILLHVLESEQDRISAEAYLEAVEAKAGSQGVVATSLLESGNVVDEILDVARFHDADLIAMATHGRRGLSRLLTGSTTEGVLRRGFFPVLVVRTSQAAASEGRESVA